MDDQNPITTKELLIIAAKEIGKAIPALGNLISAQEAVFGAIEMNRVKVTFEEVFRRIERLERSRGSFVFDEANGAVLLYGAEQVRSDPLAATKAREYGAAITHYLAKPDDLNEMVEILDSLRKVSAGDLKVLYQFRSGSEQLPSRKISELAGYHEHVNPFEDVALVRTRMQALYPNLMRLQGLGVIYLARAYSPQGGLAPDIGGLSDDFQKFAFLTDMGKRLVNVLPR